jgi:hypothetical protein
VDDGRQSADHAADVNMDGHRRHREPNRLRIAPGCRLWTDFSWIAPHYEESTCGGVTVTLFDGRRPGAQ